MLRCDWLEMMSCIRFVLPPHGRIPYSGTTRTRVSEGFGSVSSVLMAAQSPTDAILPQWKKAGKQGKEMQKPEEEKKPTAAKITESTK